MEKEKTGDMLHCHWSIAPMTPELLALTVKAGPPSDKRAAPSFGCWWIPHVHCLVNILMDLGLMLPKDSYCYSTLLLWARAQTGPRDRPSEVRIKNYQDQIFCWPGRWGLGVKKTNKQTKKTSLIIENNKCNSCACEFVR